MDASSLIVEVQGGADMRQDAGNWRKGKTRWVAGGFSHLPYPVHIIQRYFLGETDVIHGVADINPGCWQQPSCDVQCNARLS
jgi:hypothetical protein